jgi:RND family efflux transporter MFP subunit
MKILKTVFIFTAIVLTSCVNTAYKVKQDSSQKIKVKVATVGKNDNSTFLTFSGKVKAKSSVELSTKIMGYVDKVYINVGDIVKKGQLLITINNSDLQAKKAQGNARILEAELALKNVNKNYKRFKNLFASNSLSQKEMDDMTTNYNIAKARLENANQINNEINTQFVYANITAPFTGVVTRKNIDRGDLANPGESLISIESPNSFEVITMISETDISQIRKNIEVNVVLKSIKKRVKGSIIEISKSAKNTGGQFLVKIKLLETPQAILSGMFASIQLPVQKNNPIKTILIPIDVLVKKGQLSGVYTISQSETALLRWLRLGKRYEDKVEVLSGLSAGEKYIISAEGKLYNGAKISNN